MPFAVILSLPAGAFGSFLLLQMMGLANDIFAQVGLVMLVGLLGKNAVLIVEFAIQKRAADAIILAASARRKVHRAFLGSTADKVIRQAPCPVLVVPPGAP